MAKTIPIANPFPGGSTYTTVKKALEYVHLGRAVIIDDLCHFLPHATHHEKHASTFDPLMRCSGMAQIADRGQCVSPARCGPDAMEANVALSRVRLQQTHKRRTMPSAQTRGEAASR